MRGITFRSDNRLALGLLTLSQRFFAAATKLNMKARTAILQTA